MKTNDLINELANDASQHAPKRAMPWQWVIAGSILTGAILMFSVFDIRPDLAAAATTYGFLLKPVVAILIAVPALKLIVEVADPTGRPMRYAGLLAIGLVVLAIGVALEMMLIPQQRWAARRMGYNAAACAASVFVLAMPILAIMIFAIRQRATVKPVLAGSLAGLFAGAVSTFLYAAHCPDDSPFFLAVWYSLAVLAVMGVGAIVGRVFLRW